MPTSWQHCIGSNIRYIGNLVVIPRSCVVEQAWVTVPAIDTEVASNVRVI